MRADLELLIPRNKPERTGVRWGLVVGGATALLLLAGVVLWPVKWRPPVAHEMSDLKQTQLTANTDGRSSFRRRTIEISHAFIRLCSTRSAFFASPFAYCHSK